MKKTSGKKLNAKAKQRKLAFRGFLLDNETTQSAIAKELGVSSTAIRKSIERGAFQKGPFAEWWKENIETPQPTSPDAKAAIKLQRNERNSEVAMDGAREAAHDMQRQQTTQEVTA